MSRASRRVRKGAVTMTGNDLGDGNCSESVFAPPGESSPRVYTDRSRTPGMEPGEVGGAPQSRPRAPGTAPERGVRAPDERTG